MSSPILTISINEKRPTELMTFVFMRDIITGDGGWFTRSRMGNLPPNCLVHTNLQNDLTAIARERGMIESYNFATSRPKPKKTVRVSRSKVQAKKAKKGISEGMLSGFNPFA